MPSKIDPAVLRALKLDATTASIAPHGGSGFASTFKITSKDKNGDEKLFFVKTGRDGGMFEGEHMSLNAIHDAVPSLCPRSYATGKLSNTAAYFLVTDFLNLSSSCGSAKSGSGKSLAEKLARLHSTPAPAPEGHAKPMFGFPVATCCGDTHQDNSYKASWAEFYAENRLRGVLRSAERRNGHDHKLSSLLEQTASVVVPRLLGDGHLKAPDGSPVKPVVVHGDLWSGNHGRGTIGDGGIEEVVFDSSASYSHSEFEFGIMKMFGGFGGAFNTEYWKHKAKDEPSDEWEDRVELYQLYHHLNHYSIFGGSYKNGAMSIMRSLIKKFPER